ncbi:MAG: DUF2357 domain-containing protein [Chloroflexaceae bacterium]|nr:DUF2357 domain-containing protein [Chloroflexaceae bacterium]
MGDLLIDNQSGPLITLTEWQEVECSCVPPPGATPTLAIAGFAESTTLSPFLTPGDPAWRWRWNPRNATGQFKVTLTLTWPDGRVATRQTTLEVLPRKLDRQQYEHLLHDLRCTAATVLSALLAKGKVGATLGPLLSLDPDNLPAPDHHQLLEASWWLFDEQVPAFERAVQQIARHPHTQGTVVRERVPSGQSHDWSQAADDLARGPYLPAGVGDSNRLVPAEVTRSRTVMSFDTYENRLLKRVLHEAWQRALAVARLTDPAPTGEAAGRQTRTMAEHALLHARSLQVARRLEVLRSLPFLSQVGPPTPGPFHSRSHGGPSQVIRRNPAYRQVYRFWRAIQRVPWVATVTLERPLWHLPLHEMPRLYECWCVVQVVQALLNLPGATVRHHHLTSLSRNPADATDGPMTFTLTLAEDAPLLVLDRGDTTLALRHHPRYAPVRSEQEPATEPATIGSLDCHIHIPDLALEVQGPNQPPYVVVFDAKYRLTSSGGVPDDALADAYTYLGSLGLPSGQRAVRASVVLYPGPDVPRWFASGTGLLPLLPGHTACLPGELERLLSGK